MDGNSKIKLFVDDINNKKLVRQVLQELNHLIINFAAETHVDTSICSPRNFKTNIEGHLIY